MVVSFLMINAIWLVQCQSFELEPTIFKPMCSEQLNEAMKHNCKPHVIEKAIWLRTQRNSRSKRSSKKIFKIAMKSLILNFFQSQFTSTAMFDMRIILWTIFTEIQTTTVSILTLHWWTSMNFKQNAQETSQRHSPKNAATKAATWQL